MDGYAAQGELSPRRRDGRVRFRLATPADDPEIRRLLRENPMPGRVTISLEREPEASLAAAVEGDLHHAIVARDEPGGLIIAMGSVSVRNRFVNGDVVRVGYLGQLRVDHRHRGRMSIIRGGYAMLRELHPALGVRLYLTSIASDNAAARRLLERGLPGMPTYRPLCEFVTMVFRRLRNGEFQKVTADVRRGLRRSQLELRHGSTELLPALADLLNATGALHQFAPAWSHDELASLTSCGLRPSHLRIILQQQERPIACGGVWDQRAMKQSVIRGYPPALRWGRVPLNLLAPFLRLPRLPRIGQPVSSAFISHVATPADRLDLIEPLIRSLHGSASLGVDCLVIGFDARDPRLNVVRRAVGGMEYRTQLYVVHWPDDAAAAEGVDRDRLVAPEVALL